MTGLPDVSEDLAWPRRDSVDSAALPLLDGLVPTGEWGGPLLVAMPRTGSTLLGTIFLLARHPPQTGGHVFSRYLHEPVAPLYWRGEPMESVVDTLGGTLTSADIVQENGYQFAAPEVARWFLSGARRPVAFTMRHPRIAWPSRWRVMLREWLHHDPSDPDAGRFRHALSTDDFSALGDVLTTRVPQPANGWHAFIALLRVCEEEGIEFALIDNARFRADPEAVLRVLCRGWGIEFDPALVDWDDLDEARPRIVMSDLGRSEYPWYYAATLGGRGGIRRQDRQPLPHECFPDELRGASNRHLTIDRAEAWYTTLLRRKEVI